MEERWEMQWQQFLKTLEAVQPGEVEPGEGKSQMSEASPWEDPKVFLVSFEQVATACRWPRAEWVAHLLPALCGEAKEAFEKLEIRERDSYGKVRAAILKGEAVKTEAQRRRFRQFCCQEVEDPEGVYKQVKELCHLWLKPERHTKEQILELLILEQFLASLPPELKSWVQARRPDTCSQAVALVEESLRCQQETRSEARQEPPTEEPTTFERAEKEPLIAGKRKNAEKEPLVAGKRKNAKEQPLVAVKRENAEEEPVEAEKRKNAKEQPLVAVKTENIEQPLVAVKRENVEVEIGMPAAEPRSESPDPPSSLLPSEMDQTPLKETPSLEHSKMSPAKKAKTDSGRSFQEAWTNSFGVIEHDGKALCVLCNKSVVCRTSSVKRHLDTNHKSVAKLDATKRKEFLEGKLRKYHSQHPSFSNSLPKTNHLTAPSFKIPLGTADGDIIKMAMLSGSDYLFHDFPNKDKIIQRISEMPLSINTVKDMSPAHGK